MPTKAQLQKCLEKLYKNLNSLQEKKAKLGLDVSSTIVNQIDDHQEAIELVSQAIEGRLSEKELEEKLAPLTIDLQSCTQPGFLAAIPKSFLVGGLAVGLVIALLLFLITPQAQFLAPPPTPTPLFTTPAAPGQILILVAEFENPEGKTIRAGQRIHHRLQEELAKARLDVRLELAPQIGDPATARKVGEIYGAKFVIWGWTDDVSMFPNFSIIDPIDDDLLFMPTVPEKLLDLPDFNLFVTTDLPEQMTFFSKFTLGQIYFRNDDYEQAARLFDLDLPEQAQNLPPEVAAIVRFYQGFTALKLDKPEEALPYFSQAITLDPTLYQAYHNRGVIYMLQGSYEQAVLDFNKAIDIKADVADIYAQRGFSFKELGHLDKALADFDKALGLDPDAVYVYYYRAVLYQDSADPDQALAAYNRFIELSPEFPIAYFNRALIYVDAGDYEPALADYQKALAVDTQQEYEILIKLNLGWTYYLTGDYETAIEIDQAVLDAYQDLGPDHPEFFNLSAIRYNLALALLAAGQLERAETAYDMALSRGAIPPLIEAAIADLEELRARQPDTAGATEIMAKLRAHKF
ncbi:MAG: tetratricopeptide repeat protein [Chloroflexota bacterium]